MHRRYLLPIVLPLACAWAIAPAAGASAPTATAAKACSIRGVERSLGPSYVTSLRVIGTSCTTGKSVVRGYYNCRRANGVRGYCHRKVLGYSCSERRSGIPIQFDATVTCSNGVRRVYHSYTQNT